MTYPSVIELENIKSNDHLINQQQDNQKVQEQKDNEESAHDQQESLQHGDQKSQQKSNDAENTQVITSSKGNNEMANTNLIKQPTDDDKKNHQNEPSTSPKSNRLVSTSQYFTVFIYFTNMT